MINAVKKLTTTNLRNHRGEFGDGGEREFDLLIDGKVAATATSDNGHDFFVWEVEIAGQTKNLEAFLDYRATVAKKELIVLVSALIAQVEADRKAAEQAILDADRADRAVYEAARRAAGDEFCKAVEEATAAAGAIRDAKIADARTIRDQQFADRSASLASLAS